MINLKVSAKRLPIYSGQHPLVNTFQHKLEKLPFGHQVVTFDALAQAQETPGVSILFNTCGTGLGKTYAAFAPSILNDFSSCSIYPTNALIEDQFRSLNNLAEKLDKNYLIYKATARDISREAKHVKEDRREIFLSYLKRRPERARILLTNPDLFYITLSLMFGRRYKADLAFPLVADFSVFIFDEFHLYNWKQLANLLFFISLLDEFRKSQSTAILFLSATPNYRFIHELKHIYPDMELLEITEDTGPLFATSKKQLTVVTEINLQIYNSDYGLQWIISNIEMIKDMVAKYKECLISDPEAKIIIILNSIFAAREARKILEEALQPLGLNVGAWHGYNPYTRKYDFRNSHVLVGTQAIEVGVDFKALLLIFEADNAASFLQRFGRVGRVASRQDWVNFPFLAIALVPNYVYNYLSRTLYGKKKTQRNELESMILQAFQKPTQFFKFYKKYSLLEHYSIAQEYVKITSRQRRVQMKNLLSKVLKCLHGSFKNGKIEVEIMKLQQTNCFDDMQMFRGNNLRAVIYDKTEEERGKFPFLIYDLDYILRRGRFHALTESWFSRIWQQEKEKWIRTDWESATSFDYDLQTLKRICSENIFFLKVTGFLRRPLYYSISGKGVRKNLIDHKNRFYVVPATTETRQINNQFKKIPLTYYAVDRPINEVRTSCKFSPYFKVYSYTGYYDDYTKSLGTIAFGLQAYLLASEMQDW